MLSQTAVCGLWTTLSICFHRSAPVSPGRDPKRWRAISAGALIAMGVFGLGAVAWHQPALYLGAILAWAALPLAAQCGAGADLLLARAGLWATAIVPPVLYWWTIDRFAISVGVWRISEQYTLGLRPSGLPLEEAVFFLATSALVVNGVLLGADPSARARLANGAGRRRPFAPMERLM